MEDIQTPRSKAQVRDRIAAIVHQAEASGIDVRGAYGFSSSIGQHDWEVQIFPIKTTEQ